eukprot:NODE_642_length_5062_cov_1.602861.p3 type:complete len:253 gc:universal NODE_642_length_5062_cov_1.602861:2388-3146(+)
MKGFTIPNLQPLDSIEYQSPPAQTQQFTRYLNTPNLKPQTNILLTNINKNDFIQFLVLVSKDLMLCHTSKMNPNFIFELFSRCKASLSLVQATLIYYIRCKQNPVSPYFWLQEEKLFIGCIMLAHLYLMDSTYNMKSWKVITGLDTSLLKIIRHITLEVLDHKLWIDRGVYSSFNMKLLELYQIKNWNINDLVASIQNDLNQYRSTILKKSSNEASLRESILNNPSMDFVALRDTISEPLRKKRKFMEMPAS